MTTQLMASPQAARIAKFKGEILQHAVPQEVIGRCCRSQKKSIPKNTSATVQYRRWLPKGATSSTPNTCTGGAPATIGRAPAVSTPGLREGQQEGS